MVLAIFIEDHPRNFPVKICQNPSTGLRKETVDFFLALAAILFNAAEPFEHCGLSTQRTFI